MSDNNNSKRGIQHIFSGLAIYAIIATLIGIGVGLRLPPVPTQFSSVLASSYDPQKALISFSLLLGGVIMIFFRIGVEFPFFRFGANEDVKRYMAGLPLWTLLLIIAASALAFWNYYPACRPPESVYFEILGTGQNYQPMDYLIVQPGQSFSIAAKSDDPSVQLSCISWEFVGPAFAPTGDKLGCQVNLRISAQPGISSLSVITTQNFCDQKSIFSLQVSVQSP